MAVEITGTYDGALTCTSTHGPSRSVVRTTAPVDNGGTGDLFSPTDLLATALGACMVTIVGLWAKKHDVDVSGTTYRVVKDMVEQPRRRIGKLEVEVRVPASVPAALRASLEASALRCPVKETLRPDTEFDIHFLYEASIKLGYEAASEEG